MISNHLSTLSTISPNDILYAREVADRMFYRHGYWMAMYHCMTLAIWCRKRENTEWDIEELTCVEFWWAVRNLIYRRKR